MMFVHMLFLNICTHKGYFTMDGYDIWSGATIRVKTLACSHPHPHPHLQEVQDADPLQNKAASARTSQQVSKKQETS